MIKYFFILLVGFTVCIYAETGEERLARFAAMTTVSVVGADTYWDGGSIGVSLKSDQGERFEIRTINPRISPHQRMLLLSIPLDQKAVIIAPNSAIEKELIRLLKTQPHVDSMGFEVSNNLIEILQNRDTPWENHNWYTPEYLKQNFPKSKLTEQGAGANG